MKIVCLNEIHIFCYAHVLYDDICGVTAEEHSWNL
jgi:hypothetical protein